MEEMDQMALVSNLVISFDLSAFFHVAVTKFINKNMRPFLCYDPLFLNISLCFLHCSI